MIKILIIDKEPDMIRRLLADWQEDDYECCFAITITDGVEKFLSFRPDIILTEYVIQTISVKQLIHRIRHLAEVPIIVLSSRTDETAILNSLQYGADDFVKKQTCGSKELFFRILKILKNFRGQLPSLHESDLAPDLIHLHDIIINKNTHEVKKNHHLIFLSTTEYRLLLLLACQKNHVVKTQVILAQLFPNKEERRIKPILYTYFSNIRKKLSMNATSTVQIKAVSGEGYCLIVN